MFKRNLIFLFLFLSSFLVSAQEKKSSYSIGGNFFNGFILNHSPRMGPLSVSYPTGFELTFTKNTYGLKNWERLYNLPDVNFSLSYLDFQNTALGFSIAGLVSMDYFFSKKDKKQLFVNIGAGFVYTSNPYDAENNPLNIAISTPISYAVQAKVGHNFNFGNSFTFTPALSIIHYSNGAYKMPNEGINIIVLNAGLSYRLKKNISSELDEENLKWEVNRNISKYLVMNTGLKSLYQDNPKKFSYFTFSGGISKMLTEKNAISIGSDLFLSKALQEKLKDVGSSMDFKTIGLAVGHELMIGKLSLVKQFGYYIYKPDILQTKFYQRYSLRYYCTEKTFLNANLKVHGGTADVVEWGIGWRI
jgi:hypothetical protein